MNRLDSKKVEEFLYRYGWDFTRLESPISDRAMWSSGWRSDFKSYPLRITLASTWVLFEVKPLFKFDCNCEVTDDLCRVAMELNADMQLAKLSLTEESEIILSMQFFNNLQYEEFANVLGILGYYADMVCDLISEITPAQEASTYLQFVS